MGLVFVYTNNSQLSVIECSLHLTATTPDR